MQSSPNLDSIAASSCIRNVPCKRSETMDDLQNLTFKVAPVKSVSRDSKWQNRCDRKKTILTSCKRIYSRSHESDYPPTKKLKMIEAKKATVLQATIKDNHLKKKSFTNLVELQQKVAQENFRTVSFHSSDTNFCNIPRTVIDYNDKNESLISKNNSEIINETRQDTIDVRLCTSLSENLQNNSAMQLDSCSRIENHDKLDDDYVIDIKNESLDDEFNIMKSDDCLVLDDELACNDKSESCSFHNASVNSNLSTR